MKMIETNRGYNINRYSYYEIYREKGMRKRKGKKEGNFSAKERKKATH